MVVIIFRGLAFLAMLVVLVGTASADPSTDASAAYARRDYGEALRLLRVAAQNDANAQFRLSQFLIGNYFPAGLSDIAESDRWLRAAAENNLVAAQIVLAELYRYGRRVPKDESESLRWYRRAANQGDPRAQYELANFLWNPLGANQDQKEAIRWFRASAEGGWTRSQSLLAFRYIFAEVVPRDYTEAFRWFLKSAADEANRGWVEPAEFVGTLYEQGLGTARDYVQAIRWFEIAAKDYSPYAEFELGILNEHGRGTQADLHRALGFYRAAALKGYAPAQYRLGTAYLIGEDMRTDRAEALKWLLIALHWDPSDKLDPPSRAQATSIFEQDPDLFRPRTAFLRPEAYDYAVSTARQLSKDPAVYAKARALAAAFQPTVQRPPIP